MSHQHENHGPHDLTPAEQAAIERVLASTSPAPPRLDRDRLMFLAGAASVDCDLRPPTSDLRPLAADRRHLNTRTAWRWPAATAALAATSLALAIVLLTRLAPSERIVYVPQPVELASGGLQSPEPVAMVPINTPAPSTSEYRSPTSHTASYAPGYLRTRDVALRLGLDALGTLPSGASADAPAPTYRSLLESLTPALPRSPSEPAEWPQM